MQIMSWNWFEEVKGNKMYIIHLAFKKYKIQEWLIGQLAIQNREYANIDYFRG